MEDATITQEPLIKERFPSVVDTDDLIFELGKKDIKVLNLEKLLNSLIEKSKVTNQMAVDLSKAKTETTERITSLQESNKLYEENNRNLDSEIVRLRSAGANAEASYKEELRQLQERMDKDRVEYEQKIQKLEADIEEALKPKKTRRRKKTIV